VDRPELTPDTPFAFVDVETTGGGSAIHRVIEVAVVAGRGAELEFEWRSFVNPGVHVPAGITALTGIDDDLLADAPSFERIAAELRSRLEGRVFVAHNARFDYGFIRREFGRAGYDWSSPSVCTVRLSRKLYPEMPRHNLDAVIEYHGLDVPARHRALPDAQALWQFWLQLRAAWPHEELQLALQEAARRPDIPPGLPADLPDDLPELPGVYRLYGGSESGADGLLYVGKANNLRERVLDHFRGRDGKSQRLASQTRRVTWTATAGELGALLLEAREIRERQPAYNKQLRGAGRRYSWLFEDPVQGKGAPRLVALDARILRSGNAYGAWRSEREARRALESLAREHGWCLKVLGLEAGEGSCFGLQVDRCSGVCIGREPAALHLARIKMGLVRQQLPPWPHPGPVVVSEGRGECRQYHVVEAWQHLATFDGDEADDGIAEYSRGARRAQPDFDADVFHILRRALKNRRVVPLKPAMHGEEMPW
jgi:DNA polymerase-3 subunit epsilon